MRNLVELEVIMLIQTSLLSSVEAGLCYVSDDGKDVLCDRMPSGETWQVCLKCNKYPLDWCRKAEPVEEDRRSADDTYRSSCLVSLGRPSTSSIMTENTAPNMVYRRKKLRKDSIFKLGPTNMQASANCPSVISSAAHLSSAEDQPADFQVKHETEMVKDPTVPSVLFDGVAKGGTHKNLGIDSVNDSCSSSKPNMEPEMDETGECSSSSVIVMDATMEEVTEKDFCINTLRSHGLLREDPLVDNVASGEDAVTTGNSCCSRSCKICGHLDSSLNMLLCDHCEDAYHPSCYNPRLKKLPIDEWFCHSCLKKRQKILKETVIRSPGTHNELGKCRTDSVKAELNPILLMLRDTKPYTTGVRVGKGFQAEVLDWSGPTKSFIGRVIGSRSSSGILFSHKTSYSLFHMALYSASALLLATTLCSLLLHEENTRDPIELSSIGNWIQCREVIDRANGTICGKWRSVGLNTTLEATIKAASKESATKTG
ncbi:PHD and RING finger domain-containing protein 1, partial [Mucuna pruriens]